LRAYGPIDSLWLPINHHKECSCWSRWMPAPLLPVLHRALIHATVPSKLFLRHPDFLTNRPDIEMLRDVDAVLTRICLSGGVRQGLACAGQIRRIQSTCQIWICKGRMDMEARGSRTLLLL
jgi:hypothetical protein